MDECGINNNEAKPRGYAQKGERLFAEKPGQRLERISIVAALHNNELIAPLVFKGNCTAKVIEAWLEHELLPTLPKGKVIIMEL